MDDDNISNFVAITSCEPDKAAQYLRLTDGNFEQAIQLYFDSPNLEFGPPPSTAQAPTPNAASSAQNPINVDSDDDMSDFDPATHASTPPSRAPPTTEDDEAMARRMQEEMYGGGSTAPGPEEVRAPMQRTTETLVGPDANWGPDDAEQDVDAMVQEQLARRRAGMSLLPLHKVHEIPLTRFMQGAPAFSTSERHTPMSGTTQQIRAHAAASLRPPQVGLRNSRRK